MAAAGNQCLLWGPVGPAQRDPAGPAGRGGVVVLVPAGDAAPAEPGVRRVLPAGEGRRDARLPPVQGCTPLRQRRMAEGRGWLPLAARPPPSAPARHWARQG